MKRRRGVWVTLLLLVMVTTGCQYLQNEFFQLDVARPEPECEDRSLPW